MERDLFAKIYCNNGQKITIGHIVHELGEWMYNYNSCKSTKMERSTFHKLLESLKNDNRVTKVETWEGLLDGEYVNIHTGEIEKIYGF